MKRVQSLVVSTEKTLKGPEIIRIQVNGPDGDTTKTGSAGVFNLLTERVLIVVADLIGTQNVRWDARIIRSLITDERPKRGRQTH